jgi:hypothetical protein
MRQGRRAFETRGGFSVYESDGRRKRVGRVGRVRCARGARARAGAGVRAQVVRVQVRGRRACEVGGTEARVWST